jgi:predicted dehydrogenase
MQPRAYSRRRFLATASAAAIAPAILHATPPRPPPSERINLGFIGVGIMGRGHLGRFLGQRDVQVIAVCDVVAARRDHCKQMVENRYAEATKQGTYKGCRAYNDFRDLLAHKDIDAVVISTPDHWHAIPCIRAAEAKKDIYCEKPLTHGIEEGRKIVEAVAKHQVIFQTGSQQRSEFGGLFRKAVELVRNGAIGKVHTIHIGVGGPPVRCDLPGQDTPFGTNWDLWLGPAPPRAFNDILCPRGNHNHFPAWRNYREYAGGGLADMGAHHFDIAQWALNMDAAGPVRVEPPATGNAGLKFTYANGVVMIHGYPGEDDLKFKGLPRDCIFEGSDGMVAVSRGAIKTTPAELVNRKFSETDFRCYPSNDHHRNWLDCIKTRKECICPAEAGHRTATICHLGAIGYDLRRTLTWDPAKERFDDEEANRRLRLEARGDWRLD